MRHVASVYSSERALKEHGIDTITRGCGTYHESAASYAFDIKACLLYMSGYICDCMQCVWF